MSEQLPLSVFLISYNEEENIGRTLESIQDIASEIILVDSHSTDRTRDIAKEYGVKIYEEDWKGHIAQKNSALEKCSEEWVFSLDCDEVVSDRLIKSIVEVVKRSESSGYEVNRKTFYMGRFLEYVWQPDWKLRIAKRSLNPKWEGYNPHDILKISGPSTKLNGYIYHYTYKSIEDHFDRTVKYAKIAAQSYHERKRSFRWHKQLFSPLVAFVKVFILQRGFLDGYRGFIVATSSFIYVFLKYVFLWELNKKGRKI